MAWRKMILFVLLISGIVIVGVMGLNYVVNPLGKYDSTNLPSLVWTGRADKVELLEEFDEQPDVLILGSSRSMKLDPDFIEDLSGLTAFNAGVNSARAEDYYVMLRYILEHMDKKPKYILLGIDVEAFHNKTAIDDRLLYNETLAQYLHDDDKASLADKLRTLLSYNETAATFTSLYYAATGYPKPETTYEDDGFLHYIEKEQEIVEGDFQPEIDEYIEKYRSRFNGFTELSKDRKRYFQQFLALAEKHNIVVFGFITTLHDDVIADLRKTRNYDEIKAELIEFLNEQQTQHDHFHYEDFDRVDQYGGSLTAFYDGAHIHEENANLIIEKLLKKASLLRTNEAAYLYQYK